MIATIESAIPPDAVRASWSRARHAHLARRWWSLWNQGAPVAELVGVETQARLALRFAVPPVAGIADDASTFALLQFLDRVRDVSWPSARLDVVRSADGLIVLPRGAGAPTSADLAQQAADALGNPSMRVDANPPVLPTITVR